MSKTVPSYASEKKSTASLYVGDLSSEVTEGMLFETFNQIGPVASIRVCRDAVTRRSLGYAYVNFHSIVDAERALESLNNTSIKGKLCRVMWSQRDPSVRKSGAGNIFIKNLDKSIDHKTLHDTFSMFGTILSCKVVTDAKGESKGYGFVHYDSPESAQKAIKKVDGMMLANKTVYVAPFVPKAARLANGTSGPRFTNVYTKNLPETVQSDDDLKKFFESFGKITSVWLAKEKLTKRQVREKKAHAKALAERRKQKAEEAAKAATEEKAEGAKKEEGETEKPAANAGAGNASEKKAELVIEPLESLPDDEEVVEVSKGFGFVNFDAPEDAVEAIKALNGNESDNGRLLYVGRAQKKHERESELRRQAEKRRAERMSKYAGVNLYIKNLEDTVDDDKLREEFKAFGTITSCRVMRDDKQVSKGFGFVCFETAEEATRAVTDMNGKMLGSKPIYVALAQRKDVRRQQLELQHARRGAKPITPGMAGNVNPGMFAAGAPVFYAPAPAAPTGTAPGFVYPQQMMPRGAPNSRQPWNGAPGQYIQPGYPMVGGVRQQMGPGGRRAPRQQAQQQQQQRGATNNAPAAASVRTDVAATMQKIAQAPLDPKRIAELPVEQQKLVLGEKLYPLIYQSQPQLAGKITGMLLDSYFTEEIIHLIETPDALRAKISEALTVLEQHAAKQKAANAAE